MPAVCLRSWCASFTTALPFSSSSPTLSRPTPGRAWSSTSRTYTDPRCAKPTSSRASQSTLAPPSSTRTGCTAVGNSAPIAARCTPSCSRSIRVAAAITAPVLPAEMNASRPLLLEADPDGDGGAGLALDGGQGLLAHAHHLGCLDDLEAVAVDGAVRLERGLDVAGPPHELDPERGGEFAQGLDRALDLHSRRVV